jgi:hypothetical protein
VEQNKWIEGKEIVTMDEQSTNLFLQEKNSANCVEIRDPKFSPHFFLSQFYTKFYPNDSSDLSFVSRFMKEGSDSKKVKGIREIEYGLKMRQPLFVMGEFQCEDNEIYFRKPRSQGINDTKSTKSKPYIVTMKTEDVLLTEIETEGRTMKIFRNIFGTITLGMVAGISYIFYKH